METFGQKIKLLVFEGNLLKETDDHEPSNQGFLVMLLTTVKLLCHISIFNLFRQDFSQEDLVDSNLEKLHSMTKDQQNIFLIQEFEHLLSEINCPIEYIMELLISDIMRDDYVIEKVMYRRRKIILLTYRGLQFLLEKRFEIF